VRKNINSLSSAEWTKLLAGLNRLKASGDYDAFTWRHMNAMMELTLRPGETNSQRNVAHRGPAFLPWHRKSLLEFEAALGMQLPYFAWDGLGRNWKSAPIWNRIGGNGDPRRGYALSSGPFAGWVSLIYAADGNYYLRDGLVRQFDPAGSMGSVSVSGRTYDVNPFSESSNPSNSFRQTLEDAHNNIHVLVGGDFSAGTSPNDPLFWFHHCNVDRIFYRWQQRNGFNNYAPVTGGPLGHNKNDILRHVISSSTTIASVLDPRPLGITYDTLG
jgi:tyrosinase